MRSLIFFGSSPFSTIVLEKLINRVSAVVTTPDKPAGRGLKLKPNPVKLLAQKHKIPVVETMNDLMTMYDNCMTSPIGLVVAYGKIIPQSILDKFNGQIYNIHPSLLPKYRGPSPLQQQILDGITETGVTIIKLDEKMDHGPIVAIKKDTILPNDTWITLGERLFSSGADLFLHVILNEMKNPDFPGSFAIAQDDTLATYTKKLTRQDGFLPWDQFIKFDYNRKFRAFYSWPGIWSTDPHGKRLKLVSLVPILVQYAGQKPQSWPQKI